MSEKLEQAKKATTEKPKAFATSEIKMKSEKSEKYDKNDKTEKKKRAEKSKDIHIEKEASIDHKPQTTGTKRKEPNVSLIGKKRKAAAPLLQTEETIKRPRMAANTR